MDKWFLSTTLAVWNAEKAFRYKWLQFYSSREHDSGTAGDDVMVMVLQKIFFFF